jgi:hypothetical protein
VINEQTSSLAEVFPVEAGFADAADEGADDPAGEVLGVVPEVEEADFFALLEHPELAASATAAAMPAVRVMAPRMRSSLGEPLGLHRRLNRSRVTDR